MGSFTFDLMMGEMGAERYMRKESGMKVRVCLKRSIFIVSKGFLTGHDLVVPSTLHVFNSIRKELR
jgi:hypothetical protein